GRMVFILADSAAAPAPSTFAVVALAGVEEQRRSSHRHHVGTVGLIQSVGSPVAAGRKERDTLMATGRLVDAIVTRFPGEFAAAVAHRDNGDSREPLGVSNGVVDIAE